MIRALTWQQYRFGAWRQYIMRALLKGSNTTINEVERRIKAGEVVPLALGDKALATFELGEDSLHGITIAGELEPGWELELLPVLESIAREQNRRIIALRGRRGWIRKLRPLGFTRDGERLIKEVA
jgi:hypothetical protein